MDSTKIDLMALAEGGGPSLSKNLSDLRGKSMNKDRLSMFQQPQQEDSKPISPKTPGTGKVWTRPEVTGSYDSIPKPVSPKSPGTGKVWTRPEAAPSKSFADTLSPNTVVSAPAEKPPPIPMVSSNDKVEEEVVSPKLGDNPFLQKDRRSSGGEPQEADVPKRISRGDSSGYMGEDESSKPSAVASCGSS